MEVGAGRAPGPKGIRGLRETGTRRELVSRLLVESCCEVKEERKARARSQISKTGVSPPVLVLLL